jgi:hypothetical protein
MTSIRSCIYAAGLLACLSGILFTTYKPTTNLGNGFSTEGGRPFSNSGSRGGVRHLWLTQPDGKRIQLSEVPVARQSILRTNSIVVWEESRVTGQGAFDVYYTSFHFAADATGRRVDLTDWLMDRAERILPSAAPESLPAYLGSDPTPTRPGMQDPRVGVHSFKPITVQFAHWRPGITFWCTVPCNGSYRPLAMQVPLDEIAAQLRTEAAAVPKPRQQAAM